MGGRTRGGRKGGRKNGLGGMCAGSGGSADEETWAAVRPLRRVQTEEGAQRRCPARHPRQLALHRSSGRWGARTATPRPSRSVPERSTFLCTRLAQQAQASMQNFDKAFQVGVGWPGWRQRQGLGGWEAGEGNRDVAGSPLWAGPGVRAAAVFHLYPQHAAAMHRRAQAARRVLEVSAAAKVRRWRARPPTLPCVNVCAVCHINWRL